MWPCATHPERIRRQQQQQQQQNIRLSNKQKQGQPEEAVAKWVLEVYRPEVMGICGAVQAPFIDTPTLHQESDTRASGSQCQIFEVSGANKHTCYAFWSQRRKHSVLEPYWGA